MHFLMKRQNFRLFPATLMLRVAKERMPGSTERLPQRSWLRKLQPTRVPKL